MTRINISKIRVTIVLILLTIMLGTYAFAQPTPNISPDNASKNNSLAPSLGAMSLKQGLRFEENNGQVAGEDGKSSKDILFTMKDKGITLFFTKNGIAYQWYYTEELMNGPINISEATGKPVNEDENGLPEKLKEPKPSVTHTYRMDMQWLDASEQVEVVGEQPFEDYNNYYLAQCPDGINGVKSYAQVTYKNMYPNIDVVYYVKEGHLKYDIVVNAGGNIEDIQFAYTGHSGMQPENEALKIETPLGFLTEGVPVAFQGDREVPIHYKVKNNTLSFELDNSSPQNTNEPHPLIIDPTLVWGTYYGGTGWDESTSPIAMDGTGSNVYLAGYTESTTAIASGGHQNTFGGIEDAFLVKFSSAGVRQWGTYYGGTSGEYGSATAVDGSGNVYLAGNSYSTAAISSGGHQNTIGGLKDAFLVKFSSAGVRQWGTYYGGTGDDEGKSTAVDGSGNVYLAGYTANTTAIASGGHQNTFGGVRDAFLVKFSSAGVRQWGTYYGGTDGDYGYSTAVDGTGNVYLTGLVYSTTAIASGGHQNTIGGVGVGDAFLVKFSSAGVRQWGTYYGGSGFDYGNSTALDGAGNVYLAGLSESTTAIFSGGHQNTIGGLGDAFLVKFSSAGVRQWGTYYGGTGEDEGKSTAVDGFGNVYLAGWTGSTTAIASGGYQNTFGGNEDAFLVKFSSAGVRQWGSYYGAGEYDNGFSTAVDGFGNVYLAGATNSTTAIASGGHQNTFGGVFDAFLVKFSMPLEPTAQPTNLNFTNQQSTSFTVNFTAASGNPDGYIALMKEGSSPSFEPVDGMSYIFNEEPDPSGDPGTFTVLIDVFTSFGIQSVTPGATLYFDIYSYNGSGSDLNYLTTIPPLQGSFTTPSLPTKPTVQASNLIITQPFASTIDVIWTNGNGSGRIVIAKQGTVDQAPVDGTTYTASSSFSSGDDLGGGNYVVYNGTGNSVSVTDIQASTSYQFFVFEYNGGAGSESYNISTATGNPKSNSDASVVPDLSIPYSSFGSAEANYRIITVPLNLTNNKVSDVFNELMPYDDTKWRMFRYQNGSNQELNANSTISPGQGYWLIVKNNTTLSSGPGTTVTAPFSVTLVQGWNQIGNPYNFNISWADVQAANPGLPGLRKWINTMTDGTTLSKMEGGFVNATTAGTLVFPPISIGGRKSEAALPIRNSLDSPNWQVYLNVDQGELMNRIAGVGMNEQAQDDYDIYDGLSMPHFFDSFLEVNHTKALNGNFYSKDIVATKENNVWDFTVETNGTEQIITLSWDNSYFGDNDRELYLRDVTLQRSINMRTSREYAFDKNVSRSFQVLFGSADFVKEKSSVQDVILHQAWPNPAEDEINVSFSLPEIGQGQSVRLELVDLMGRKIWSHENVFESGFHEVQWKRSKEEAAGIYLVTLKAAGTIKQVKVVLR